eukprot:4297082-Amphidinium_carterae.1
MDGGLQHVAVNQIDLLCGSAVFAESPPVRHPGCHAMLECAYETITSHTTRETSMRTIPVDVLI